MFKLRVDEDVHLELMHDLDAANYVEAILENRSHIGAWLPWVDEYDDDKFEGFVKMMRQGFADESDWGTFIYYQGQFVGGVGLHTRDAAAGIAEIGYWLMKDVTGKGIMTRAVKALIDYGFMTRNLKKIFIRAATGNTKSRAIPERLGFTREAIFQHDVLLRGTFQDAHYYAMLRDEWTVTHQQPEFALPVDENIELRLFESRHAEALFALTDKNREHLRTWLPWLDMTTTASDSAGFIKSGLSQYGAKNGFQAGIWYQDELAGAIGYHYWDFLHKKTEIGYWLSADYTGKGIMTRATRALVDFAFHQLDLERVSIPCAVGNAKSCAIPQRLGFTHEGVLQQAEWLYDHYVDHNMFAMLKGNWQ